MIRKSLEPETKVWHESFGIGTFKGWSKLPKYAKVEYENLSQCFLIPRKELTEIEEEK